MTTIAVYNLRNNILYSTIKNKIFSLSDLLIKIGADVNNANKEGENILTYAIKKGDKELFDYLLRKNINLNRNINNGMNILSFAILNKRYELIKSILKRMKNINKFDSNKKTPLFYALKIKDEKIIRLLLEKGAKVCIKSGKHHYFSPIHYAAKNGYLAFFKQILKIKKINIDFSDNKGKTPLHHACKHGHLKIVKFLINHGANPEARDKADCTPLFYASFYGYIDIVKYLVTKKVNINTIYKIKRYYLSPLFAAAGQGHKEILEYLYKKGGNIKLKNAFDYNVFLIAADKGRNKVLKYLLSLNIFNINETDIYSRTPVLLASLKGHFQTVKLLYNNGADIKHKNFDHFYYNYSPFYASIKGKNKELINFFLNSGEDINQQNHRGITPLMVAIKNRDFRTAKYLLSKGADPNICDYWDNPPLYYAIENKDFMSVKTLIDYGADVNYRSVNQNYLINNAIYNKSLKIIKYIVEHGFDIKNYYFVKYYDWVTFHEKSMDEKKKAIYKYLISKGAKHITQIINY